MGRDVVGDGELPVGEIRGIPFMSSNRIARMSGLSSCSMRRTFSSRAGTLALIVVVGAHGAQTHPGRRARCPGTAGRGDAAPLAGRRPGLGPVLAQVAVFLGA